MTFAVLIRKEDNFYLLTISKYVISQAQRLKYSIIKSLYKKGDKTDPSNYRPISMLTSFSKVLEKALNNRLIEYLNNNNILNSQQFGFRKNLATEDAIFRLIHEILNALNSKIMVDSIFFFFFQKPSTQLTICY
jgi:hypothetical protein